MRLTKEFIMNRINRLLITFKESWENILVELDAGIMEINSWMSTKFPLVSEVLNDDPDSTYSYSVAGIETPFFNNKYFLNIVIPYAAAELLSIDEEFGEVYTKYRMQVEDNLFIMVRDELHKIDHSFTEDFKGVYFADPNPIFKKDPETFFNKRSERPEDKYKIKYEWGNFLNDISTDVAAVITSALPVDKNLYSKNQKIPLARLSNGTSNTFIVDQDRQVLGVFVGWSLSNDNDKYKILNSDYITAENQDVKVYAVFDLDILGVRYNGNGGTLSNWKPQYITRLPDDVNFIAPYDGIATRRGFDFIGFNPPSISKDFLATNMNIEDIEFVAKWEKKTYNIIYHISGQETVIQPYTYGSEKDELYIPPVTPVNPEEFIGWWDNPRYEGFPIEKIHRTDFGDINLYAKFNREAVSVSWVVERPNGNFTRTTTNLTKGSVFLISSVPSEIINNIKNDNEYEYHNNNLYYKYRFFDEIPIDPDVELNIEELDIRDSSNNKIVFEESLIKNMTVFIKAVQKEEVNININVIDQDWNKGDNGIEYQTFQIQKGSPVDYMFLKLEDEVTVRHSYTENEQEHYSYLDISKLHLNDLGRIISDSNIDVKYTIYFQNVKGFLPEVVTTHDNESITNSLFWEGTNNNSSTQGDLEEALHWTENPIPSYNTEDLINSLQYFDDHSDYQIIFDETKYEEFQVAKTEEGIIIKERLIKAFNMFLEPEIMFGDRDDMLFFYQNEVKIKFEDESELYDLNEDLLVSVENSAKAIHVYPIYKEFALMMMMGRFFVDSPIAKISYKGTTIKEFYYKDLNHDSLLEINFNNYIQTFARYYDNTNIFEGFLVDGIEITDEVKLFNLDDIFLNQEPKEFIITPNLKYKQGFKVSFNANFSRKIPNNISIFMSLEENELFERIIKAYKDELENELGIIQISYIKEGSSVNLITENRINSLYEGEKYINLKNKFTTGLELLNYNSNEYKLIDSEEEIIKVFPEYQEYPISIVLPNAGKRETKLKINLNLELGNEFGYKRIFLSDEIIIEGGQEIETQKISEMTSDLKGLYFAVPSFKPLHSSINLDVLEGLTDIRFFDYYDNEITHSLITEDTYVKIRARRV